MGKVLLVVNGVNIEIMKKYFVYQDAKSHKFWGIEAKEDCMEIAFGKFG